MEYAGDLLTSYRSSESRDRSQDKAIGALSLETEVVLARDAQVSLKIRHVMHRCMTLYRLRLAC